MNDQKGILLADDDAEDRQFMEDAFLHHNIGGNTEYVKNGEEALASLQKRIEKNELPSLIILDLNMPRLNGTETLRALKKNPALQNIPVFIYSTSLNPIEKDDCMMMGAEGYIIKPVTFTESLKTAGFFKEFYLARQK